MRQELKTRLPEIVQYADISAAAYVGPNEVPSCQDASIAVLPIPCFGVGVAGSRHRAIYLVDTSGPVQVVAVRGTANRGDALIDLGTRRIPDPHLEVGVHEGFSRVAQAIYAQIKERHLLNPAKPVVVTGHSLGGAVALLLGMYLDAKRPDRFTVKAIYTFGQPKVFANDGVTSSPTMNRTILRVVNCGDPVPIVPISQSRLAHLGRFDVGGDNRLTDYQHLGASLILMDGGRFWMPGSVELERDLPGTASNLLADLLGHRQNEHAMNEYVERIASLSTPVLVDGSGASLDAVARYLARRDAGTPDGARAVPFLPSGRNPCVVPGTEVASR